MAKCPACDHDVRTPSFLNLDGWAHLTCTQCDARLEMKPPRSFLLGPLIAPLFVLAREGRLRSPCFRVHVRNNRSPAGGKHPSESAAPEESSTQTCGTAEH
jgi:hypothetical protein